MNRYEESLKLLERARRVTPLGAQTRSKAAQVFCEGAYPTHLQRASGCHVWDVDGNEYVDFSMGLGAVGISYDAIISGRGAPSLSLPHRVEVSYAEGLTGALGYDMVRFVKTGSEATEAAMRIARVVTGRPHIVSIGYHGWHSVHDAAADTSPGVPWGLKVCILPAAYNNLAEVEHWLKVGSVAAVIVEPTLHEPPAAGYLEGLRRACDQHGALLIFDEVICGFRWALGGGAEYFGVRPDLATFGKAMANGWPLGAVLGPRKVMEAGAKYVSGTYGGEVLSLEAGLATLSIYQSDPIIERMWEAGQALQGRFNKIAEQVGLGYRLRGYACKPYLVVEGMHQADIPDGELDENGWKALLLQELAKRGVLFHPVSMCVSASHDEAAIDYSLVQCEFAMSAIVRGAKLEGLPSRPVFQRTEGPLS